MLWPVHPCLRLMCDICVFAQCYAYMSKDLRHLIVTELPPHAYTYFCHTLEFFGCSPEHQLRCSAETRGDVYWGHMWPGLVPGEHGSTTLVLSVRRPVGQSVPGKSWGRAKTRSERRSPTARQQDKYSLQSITIHRSAQMMQDLSRGLQGGTRWERT